MEKMGCSQVSTADAMNVSPAAVTKMVSKLIREGIKKEEKRLLDKIYRALIEETIPLFRSVPTPFQVITQG